ncbi:MAG TPA: class I SAM-dependent methyltransferase [Usitatibacter sp.]|nr:class I SAM-dependent methyltransferase [Usitatibacter sp.]
MIEVSGERLAIADLPLYWRIRKPGEGPHPAIPASLPLTLRLDRALGLLAQEVDERLRKVLREVYLAESNIGYLQEGHTLAKGYGEDLFRFLSAAVEAEGVRRALEIGCGGCLMLAALAERGVAVAGVDPSPVAAEAGRRKGVEVISSFFPPPAPLEPADLIFHADVLEHVEDPVAFLGSHHPFLAERGCVAVAVPDSTESVALGDISMLMHQHVNYFTLASLRRTVSAAGFTVLKVEKSGYGGSLYCLARRGKAAGPGDASDGDEARFFERARAALGRARARIAARPAAGFYMPLRAAPYLAAFDLARPGVRVFDDTAHWHRGQIDGLPLPIENIGDLAADPPPSVFVMSLTFGDVVRDKVRRVAPGVEVSTLRELLAA